MRPKTSGVQSSELVITPSPPKFAARRTRDARLRISRSLAAQQEVEGEPGEADDQQQRVAAHEAALHDADEATARADHVLSAADQSVDDEALEDPVGEAADRQRRAHDQEVDRL